MSKFQAFRVHEKNNQVTAGLETVSFDDLSHGEVLIKTMYSSVNYKDALAITGKGKIICNFPCVGGIDVAGKVVESSDKRFREGDLVLVTGYELGTGHDGGYAEYTRVPAEWVVPLPDKMTAFEAMAIGTAGFTAALCIQRLEDNRQTPDLGPFVVTGATGGVGNFAIDMLSSLGYDVVALTGKPDKARTLTELGAARILERQSIEYTEAAMERGQWGGAIDNVGGDILAWLTKTTKPWGSIASVGLAGGSQLETTVMPFILRGVSLLGITSAGCPTVYRQPLWERLATDLAPKNLDKIVMNTISLEQLPEFCEAMLAGQISGRTVVSINPDD